MIGLFEGEVSGAMEAARSVERKALMLKAARQRQQQHGMPGLRVGEPHSEQFQPLLLMVCRVKRDHRWHTGTPRRSLLLQLRNVANSHP